MCLSCEYYSPSKLCDGAQMAIFGNFLRPVFAASREQHISDLHSHYGHAMCRSMVDIQSVAAEIRRGKEKKDDRKKSQGKNIMAP